MSLKLRVEYLNEYSNKAVVVAETVICKYASIKETSMTYITKFYGPTTDAVPLYMQLYCLH